MGKQHARIYVIKTPDIPDPNSSLEKVTRYHRYYHICKDMLIYAGSDTMSPLQKTIAGVKHKDYKNYPDIDIAFRAMEIATIYVPFRKNSPNDLEMCSGSMVFGPAYEELDSHIMGTNILDDFDKFEFGAFKEYFTKKYTDFYINVSLCDVGCLIFINIDSYDDNTEQPDPNYMISTVFTDALVQHFKDCWKRVDNTNIVCEVRHMGRNYNFVRDNFTKRKWKPFLDKFDKMRDEYMSVLPRGQVLYRNMHIDMRPVIGEVYNEVD